MKNKDLTRIAIFASGSGTNAENIIKYFSDNNNVEVNVILSNKKEAFVLKRAENLNIETIVFNRHEFYESDKIITTLLLRKIDFIVLAGFLWLIPKEIIKEFKDRIINIHPALLPKYGGKGMYGNYVHEAVIKNKEKESGISIHYVNEHYDEGQIIFQKKINVSESDTPESLAKKYIASNMNISPKSLNKLFNYIRK